MTDLIVTTLIDENNGGATVETSGGTGLSLREALALAQDGDRILFDQGLNGTIRISDQTNAPMSIDANITIDGDNRITITGDVLDDDIDDDNELTDAFQTRLNSRASDNVKIFSIGDGLRALTDVVLDGLTLTGGITNDGYGGAIEARNADLTIKDSTFAGNVTYNGAGGGAIYSDAALTIENSTFTGNTAFNGTAAGGAGGGAVFGGADVTVTDSHFEGNDAVSVDVDGGAIFAGGALTITGSTIQDNSTNGDDSQGGGVFSAGNLVITNSEIKANTTNGRYAKGGGVYGEGAVTITNGTIANNSTTGYFAEGGGIFATGALTVEGGHIYGNSTDGFSSGGGGIYGESTVVISSSTISGNIVKSGRSFGAGIYVEGDVTITNSTVAFNVLAGDRGYGGGLFANNGGVATITSSVFFGNRAETDIGDPAMYDVGVAIYSDKELTISNSIIVGNDASATNDVGGQEITEKNRSDAGDGVISFLGRNIVGASADNFDASVSANVQNGDPSLIFTDPSAGGLTDNGGPVPTLALRGDVSNPALDATTIAGTDARGSTRGVDLNGVDNGGTSDLGAFELQGAEDSVAPVITSNPAIVIAEGASAGLAQVPVTASDLTNVTFAISGGPDANRVSINAATGVLSLAAEPDFETPGDANGDNIFEVIVTATDEGENSVSATTTIRITDVDEAPVPTNGDDTLIGTADSDSINALAGNDNILGFAGDDLLLGASGNDSIKGGGGNDSLRGNRDDDTLKGGAGDDNIKGNGGEDVIRGNGGADVIRAGGGADNVKGGGGDDVIFGGGGADLLNGSGGNDTIKGNGGDDMLMGNGGADVFQFRTTDRNDTILDFRRGLDKIEIQNGANNFDALRIEQDGRDVLIGFGATGQVRVVTDIAAAFDEDDFIF